MHAEDLREKDARAEPRWVRACAAEELETGRPRSFRHGEGEARARLVLVRTEGGEVCALDDRCPHEGYPLAQGELKGEVLTCAWHNWKFDVRDGRCLLGGEDVRRYPVRVEDGAVHVDLAPPDPAELAPKLRASLERGIARADNGWAFRDAARLLALGVDSRLVLLDVARVDALRGEYGPGHALPVAADGARVLERLPGGEALVALAPAIDMAGDSVTNLPRRERPEPVRNAADDAAGRALREAIESEDAARAEGLVLGAFDAGAPRAAIEGWLYAALADHFLDFGHPLIYLVKAQELFAAAEAAAPAGANGAAGETRAAVRDVLGGLTYGIVLGTREDTLPYWAPYTRRANEVLLELPRVHAAARPGTPFDPIATRDAVLDGSAEASFDAVWEPLARGVPAREVARALVGAAAHRLLRFDVEVERDPRLAEGWLWATHRMTFAAAARLAVERQDTPDALRFLLQAAAFVHSGRRMDLPPDRRWSPAGSASDSGPADVVAAIAAEEPERALAATAALCARIGDGDPRELREALEDLCLADPRVRPIVVAHAIKTAWVGFEERRALAGHPDRDLPLLAAVRFLASPVLERRVRHQVTTALDWVFRGEMPRKLTQ